MKTPNLRKKPGKLLDPTGISMMVPDDRYKIPKEQRGAARTVFDPAGIVPGSISDKIFGAQDGSGYSAEEAARAQAMAEQGAATDEFVAGGPGIYSAGDNLVTSGLGNSRMDGIKTNSRYQEAELAALKDLEDQSKNGFTASDRADMAKTEMEVNRANRGRLGAIQQNMQSRGMGGSGMDLVAQMQSAQDSQEIAALRALEREGMMQDRKQSATAKLGDLSSQLQGRDFNQEAQKAQAADAFARFNNQLANSTAEANWNRGNSTADRNVAAGTNFRGNVLSAKQGQAQQNYDYSADKQNRMMKADQEAEQRQAGNTGAIMGTAGAVFGGMKGGPQGAQAGYTAGSGAGNMIGSTAYRNNRYPSDKACKENIAEEHPLEIEAFLQSLSPKSFDYKGGEKGKHGVIAQDLEKSSIGRGIVVEDESGMKNVSMPDAIAALFEAVSHLNKKMGG
jgi:hypothetical protein